MNIYSGFRVSSFVFHFRIKTKQNKTKQKIVQNLSTFLPFIFISENEKENLFFGFLIILFNIENRITEFWFLVSYLQSLGHYFCLNNYFIKHIFKFLTILVFNIFWISKLIIKNRLLILVFWFQNGTEELTKNLKQISFCCCFGWILKRDGSLPLPHFDEQLLNILVTCYCTICNF